MAGLAAILTVTAFAPVQAQNGSAPPVAMPSAPEVNLDYFQQQLTSFGHWINHPQFGEVWQPELGPDFRPYFNGYWQFTSDYGWLWVSNEPFGDIVYHYGRWVYDANEAWLWVPGYVWGPGWVAWRDTGEYVGWLPLPPGYSDFTTLAPQSNAPQAYAPEALYGYQSLYGGAFSGDAFASMWIFVPGRDFARRDRRPYIVDRDTVRNLYRHSKDSTHYVFDRDHDRVLDRSLDRDALERASKRQFGASSAAELLHSHVPVTTVTQGQQLSTINAGPPARPGFVIPNVPGSAPASRARRRGFGAPALINPAGVAAPSVRAPAQPEAPLPRGRPPRVFAPPGGSPPALNAGSRPTAGTNNPSTEFRRDLRPATPVFRGHIPAAAPLAGTPNAAVLPAPVVMPQAPAVTGAARAIPAPQRAPVPRGGHLQ